MVSILSRLKGFRSLIGIAVAVVVDGVRRVESDVYLFQGPVVLWVPELNISVSPSAGEHWAGGVRCECEGIDSGRNVVDESTSVDLHGVGVTKMGRMDKEKKKNEDRTTLFGE